MVMVVLLHVVDDVSGVGRTLKRFRFELQNHRVEFRVPVDSLKEREERDPVLDRAPLHDEQMLRSALQSRKWQLIGMS